MEGSNFSILPLLILIFLGLPAMVLNFEGKLQVFLGKNGLDLGIFEKL